MTINEATNLMFGRYLPIIVKSSLEDKSLMESMCSYSISHPDMYPDKMNRWLGFIQGILHVNHLIDIQEERDFSRRLYHKSYEDTGLGIPPTVELKEEK